MQRYVLGVDVGTGGTRALVIDEAGRVVSSATEEHAPFATPNTGWAEQHPDDWWRAAQLAIRKVLELHSLAPSVDAACESAVRVSQRVHPVPADAATMQKRYAAYTQIYQAMKSIFQA